SIEGSQDWKWIELPDGTRRKMTKEERNNFDLLPKCFLQVLFPESCKIFFHSIATGISTMLQTVFC
ncbi:MAG: hypothetical protein WAR23_05805, partial [Dethiobacteria bacterium]